MRTRSLGTSLLICWGFFAGAVAAAEQLTPAADATAIEGPERTGSVPRIVTDPPEVDRIAQERPSFEWRDYSLRVAPTAVPPVIDGSLGDAAWENAPVISDFTQVEPREGAQPSERTEVRLLYDANNLYVAVRCLQDATRIRGTQMQHDADLS